MTKRFSCCRCVHCLKYFDELTSDHVFPKSWYPRSTPANLQKWQAPACTKCNQEHGRNENELLIRLGLCVGPDRVGALGVSDKALKAIDPSMTRDPIEKQRRIFKRKQILAEMRMASDVPPQTFVTGFEPSFQDLASGRRALSFPRARLKMLVRKLVCGATYVLNEGLYIEADHVITVLIENRVGTDYAKTFIDRYGTRFHRGPGIVIGQARPVEDYQSAIFEILIWDTLTLHASVVDALTAAEDERNEL
jgi:hypothetical protein